VKIRSTNKLPGKPVRNGTVLQWEPFGEKEFLSSLNVFHLNILNPGITIEPHQHENEEQVFFILNGTGVITVGDEQGEVREGDAVYLPPRLTHTMGNIDTHPLRFLTIGARIKE
jgi:mannose-6-phosphate isomerase-like protein (cupin superfamily)